MAVMFVKGNGWRHILQHRDGLGAELSILKEEK